MSKIYDDFKSPGVYYRGKPFWSWNGKLEKDELLRQVDVLKEMGFGGYFMHSRTGLVTEYLGEEWFELVNAVADKGEKLGLENWLYDEDRWPSGAAGGLVTKDEKYKARCLFFTPFKDEKYSGINDYWINEKENPLACYDIILDKDGYLSSYKRISETDEAEGTKWYAFLEVHTASSWYNDQAYADTLSHEAIKKFIEVTLFFLLPTHKSARRHHKLQMPLPFLTFPLKARDWKEVFLSAPLRLRPKAPIPARPPPRRFPQPWG